MLQAWIFSIYVLFQSTDLANLAIGYYHIDCFMSLVDVSSLYQAECFTGGGQKFPADRGTQTLTALYVSKWKKRLSVKKHRNPGDAIKKEEESDRLQPSPSAIKTEELTDGANIWAISEAEAWQDRSILCKSLFLTYRCML